MHTAADIADVANSIPGQLCSLQQATQIHHIKYQPNANGNGVTVSAKKMPNDDKSFLVRVRVTKKGVGVGN